MKKILSLTLLTIVSLQLKAQLCCETAETCTKSESMAVFASNKDFQMAHNEPLPYIHESEIGEMISFTTPADGQKAAGYLLKAKSESNKYLFVYQEWWGLNDHIKRQAETFYNDLGGNVNVLAIDMYDGKVATKREDAGKYMGDAKEERLQAIMKGAVAFVGPKAKIANVGWCFGGGLSLKSALVAQKQAVGSVMYYGMPVKDVAQLKTLKCEVLGLFAGKEKWISPEVVAEFEKNMKAAKKKLQTKIFDAEHAFANPSNPNFDKVASDEAYGMALAFLKKKLKV